MNRYFQTPPVVKNLIIINLLIYMAMALIPEARLFLDHFGASTHRTCVGIAPRFGKPSKTPHGSGSPAAVSNRRLSASRARSIAPTRHAHITAIAKTTALINPFITKSPRLLVRGQYSKSARGWLGDVAALNAGKRRGQKERGYFDLSTTFAAEETRRRASNKGPLTHAHFTSNPPRLAQFH